MSRAPYAFSKNTSGGNLTAYDTALGWRFVNPRMEALYGTDPMGVTAENIAEMTGITRLEQDEFALASHQRAVAAQESGKFAEEILPSACLSAKVTHWSSLRMSARGANTNLEALSRLKPAFKPNGTVTAGNSSGLNDGAAALLVMSAERARALGLKPLARFISSGVSGIEPRIMGLGPIEATRRALKKANLQIEDISLAEVNEAFAVQTLAVMRELGLLHAITNVNGGAIALGHPLGCSGARILTTLLYEMRRRAPQEKRPFYGLATLCVGVGQGEATIIQC